MGFEGFRCVGWDGVYGGGDRMCGVCGLVILFVSLVHNFFI